MLGTDFFARQKLSTVILGIYLQDVTESKFKTLI